MFSLLECAIILKMYPMISTVCAFHEIAVLDGGSGGFKRDGDEMKKRENKHTNTAYDKRSKVP